jgi:hypothetical protein
MPCTLLVISAHASDGMSATLFQGTTASSSGFPGPEAALFYAEGDAR